MLAKFLNKRAIDSSTHSVLVAAGDGGLNFPRDTSGVVLCSTFLLCIRLCEDGYR